MPTAEIFLSDLISPVEIYFSSCDIGISSFYIQYFTPPSSSLRQPTLSPAQHCELPTAIMRYPLNYTLSPSITDKTPTLFKMRYMHYILGDPPERSAMHCKSLSGLPVAKQRGPT